MARGRDRGLHGGSWQRGSRDLYRFVGAALAAQGIVTVIPDYSLFPPARFPMSFDPQWLGQVGVNSQADVAGFIGLAGHSNRKCSTCCYISSKTVIG
jgi:acetyl esterase/lipase